MAKGKPAPAIRGRAYGARDAARVYWRLASAVTHDLGREWTKVRVVLSDNRSLLAITVADALAPRRRELDRLTTKSADIRLVVGCNPKSARRRLLNFVEFPVRERVARISDQQPQRLASAMRSDPSFPHGGAIARRSAFETFNQEAAIFLNGDDPQRRDAFAPALFAKRNEVDSDTDLTTHL